LGKDTLLNFTSVPLGEACIAEDAMGRVDTMYRCFKLTARQCEQRWGDACSDEIKQAVKDGKDPDKMIEIIHAVFPSRRGQVPAVRVFLDFLETALQSPAAG
jgi:hypothetical protein